MPKFYEQNKKRIDPRYFLHELSEDENPELPPLPPPAVSSKSSIRARHPKK
jgi:hypothetical protein